MSAPPQLPTFPLSVRQWTCTHCNTSHDRDINASINILNNADQVLSLTLS